MKIPRRNGTLHCQGEICSVDPRGSKVKHSKLSVTSERFGLTFYWQRFNGSLRGPCSGIRGFLARKTRAPEAPRGTSSRLAQAGACRRASFRGSHVSRNGDFPSAIVIHASLRPRLSNYDISNRFSFSSIHAPSIFSLFFFVPFFLTLCLFPLFSAFLFFFYLFLSSLRRSLSTTPVESVASRPATRRIFRSAVFSFFFFMDLSRAPAVDFTTN